MKRPAGVVVHAVLLALVSLLILVFALCFAVAATVGRVGTSTSGTPPAPALPPWMASFELVLSAAFVGLAAWGIATMAGLFGMRRWARYSVLIIGGGLAVLGLVSLGSSALMMAAFPAPAAAGVDPSQAQLAKTMFKVVFGAMAVFYGLLAALGITWLVYFNLKRVRAAFAGGALQLEESRRPLLIGVFAVLTMIGGLLCLLLAWVPFPALLFGFVFHGAAKAALYAGFGLAQAVAGVGLWRLREWGRRLELAFLALGAANCAVCLLRPSTLARVTVEVHQVMRIPEQPWTAHFQAVMYKGSFGVSIVLIVAMAAVLEAYKGKFGPHEEKRLGPVLVP